jgi:enamine deaminase RidA (YjgF/YER057c/UK114 family)
MGRTLYISGTASILPNGKTVYVGDITGQIEKTMEVVNAILTHNGMEFSDCTRAIAYFRNCEDITLWEHYCQTCQIPALPIISTHCDVCRDDLLFEIELDATRQK